MTLINAHSLFCMSDIPRSRKQSNPKIVDEIESVGKAGLASQRYFGPRRRIYYGKAVVINRERLCFEKPPTV